MLTFLSKRCFSILITIPLVLMVSLLLFQVSPVDQVPLKMDQGEFSLDRMEYQKIYIDVAKKYDLKLPIFYFSVLPGNYDKDYTKIIFPERKKFYDNFLSRGYLYDDVDQLFNTLASIKDDAPYDFLAQLTNSDSPVSFDLHLSEAMSKYRIDSMNAVNYTELSSINLVKHKVKSLIPLVVWHGGNNQFQHYLQRILRGNLGLSFRDQQAVGQKIFKAMGITLTIIILAVLLTYPLGTWLGVLLFNHRKRQWASIVGFILLFFSALPLFWFATMTLVFLTTPEYSAFLHIFPVPSSYGFSSSQGLVDSLTKNFSLLILPIFCLCITSLAYIVRQVSTLLEGQDDKLYVITAAMKGLSDRQVVKKHSFLNVQLPILTMFSSSIIGALGGSVVIEYIFNIPGLGRLLLDSIKYADWPVLIVIIIIVYVITALINLCTDLLYMKIDPRLKSQFDGA